jgi:hypothetical protein
VGKYLVVANQTLGGDQLMQVVRQRVAAGSSSFFVLVPNTQLVELTGPVPSASAAAVSAETEHRAGDHGHSKRLKRLLSA